MAEFKLGRLRFIWQGAWSSSTATYVKDDIVRYGGKTYMCVIGHTPNANFYTDLTVNSYWQQVSDGSAWMNNWAVSTYYKVNDLVAYGGRLYICTTGHTSNSSLGTGTPGAETTTGLEADIGKWNLYATGFNWVSAGWNTSTRYKIGDVVKYNGISYYCNTGHTSSATASLGLEDQSSYWDVYTKGLNWISAGWTTSTRYRINDVVLYGGQTYICNLGHTSASSAGSGLEADQSKWDYFNKGINYLGTWSASSVRYKVNDVVKYGADVYICTAYHTSQAAFDSNSWAIFVAGLQFYNSWTTGVTYQIGDLVTYGGYAFIAQKLNTSVNPESDVVAVGGNWQLFTTGFNFRGDALFDGTQSYKVGDVVRQNGYTYTALLDAPNATSSQGTGNATYWSRLNSGIYWNPSSQIFTGVTGTNIVGTGQNATFDVTISNTYYLVVKNAGGTGYATNDTIKILGTSVGGISPANDIIVTVSSQTSGIIGAVTNTGYSTTWVTGTAYVLGDAITYGNSSFICVQSHTASSGNKPASDTVGAYWNLLAAGAITSVMTTQGDMIYQGQAGPTRLPIGSSGQILGVTPSGIPAWNYFGVVSNVYYVSATNGVDAPLPSYGNTLDRPWKTIAYACAQVLAGTAFRNTTTLLTKNKNFLVAEMYNWMTYQTANNNTPFSGSSVYDPYKTQRDAGYVIDAIIYDLARGGNSQTVAAAYSYFQQGSNLFYNTATTNAMPFIIASLSRLATISQNIIANSAPASTYQNTTGGSAALTTLAITGITSLNNQVTFSFASQTRSPFVIGETITVTSVVPSSYNTTYTVVALSATSVTVSSTNTASYTSGGNIAGSAISQTIDANYTAETGSGSAITTLFGIITTALTAQSTVSIPPANQGVTSTINIKNGTYQEVLPISVAENTALVGDELRGVVVEPLITSAGFTGSVSGNTLTASAITSILSSQNITSAAVGIYGSTGSGGVLTVASTTGLQTGNKFVVTGTGGGGVSAGTYFVGAILTATTLTLSSSYANALAGTYITLTAAATITGTTFTATGNIISGMFVSGSATITAPLQITAQLTGASSTAAANTASTGSSGSFNLTVTSNTGITVGMFVSGNGAAISGIPANTYVTSINGTTLTLSNELTSGISTTVYFFYAGGTGTYTVNNISGWTITSTSLVASYNTANMFYVRNGAGIRNMTLSGLTGTLTSANAFGSYRPTAGAYVSLDPGTGPADSSVWIFRKSPYVQNVTTFGTACVGLKIDGTLHNGGNRSIVANDFTQVLSDGIGCWCTGSNALTELVSVFAYYNTAGYLAEAGGKIRATNGNSSYGTFGVVAEGYDASETPIVANVNNRAFQAQIANVYTDNSNKIYRLEYANAGSAYNTATYSFSSSTGYGVSTVANEFRDNGAYEVRLLTNGSSYVTITNTGQTGNTYQITIAATDTGISNAYKGMRLNLIGGAGVGQTGFVADFNSGSKIALMAKESFAPLTITVTTNASASNTAAIINPNTTGAGGGYMTTTGSLTGSFTPGMILTSAGTITAGTYITSTNTGTIGSASLASVIGSTTGTIGSITGTGPWTATITNMSSTTGFYVGMPITATTGTGTLYGGSPTSVLVTSIVGPSSITYTVFGGTTPTAGTVTNVSSILLSAGATSTGITQYALLSGGSITAGTYIVAQISATGATALATATFTGTSGTTLITLTSFTVGSISNVLIGQFIAPISGMLANTYVTAVNYITGVITVSNTLVGNVSGSTSVYTAGGLGTYGLNQTATGTPTTSLSYSVSASQTRTSAAISATQNTVTVGSNASVYNGMPMYVSATVGTNLLPATLYYAMAVVPNSNLFSVGTSSVATSAITITSSSPSPVSVYAAGWDHVVLGTSIVANLDVTTQYIIEPRLTFSSPSFTPSGATQVSGAWIDCVYGDDIATYSNISSTSSGSGTLATFNVVKTGVAYTVTQSASGGSYVIGETVVIAGTNLGGTTSNSILITVTNIGVGGSITNFTFTGTGSGGRYIAIANSGTANQYSTNGTSWTSGGALSASGAWTSIAYGAGVFVAIGAGTASTTTSTGTSWTLGGALQAGSWSAICYGSGVFMAVSSGSTAAAYSSNGSSWAATGALPASASWSGVAYGNGTYAAIAAGGTQAAYSTTGTTWVTTTLPTTAYWSSITFGKGIFVAIATGSNAIAYSLDGITWVASPAGLPATLQWTKVRYGQGLFFAVASNSTTVATSEDGINWTSRSLLTGTNWQGIAFGNPTSTPLWVAITAGTTTANSIVAGATTQARAVASAGSISSVRIIEPGSGYATTPVMTITDPNVTIAATWTVRTGIGALANPTFASRGSLYVSASVTVSGNGYSDSFQTGAYVNISGLYTTPISGSNVVFSGNSTVYKLVSVSNVTSSGSGLTPNNAYFNINPALTVANAPAHNTTTTMRIKYSQVRLTGHDFLNIGTGNFSNTNYPGTPLIAADSTKQTIANGGGRVFFTSTDQDGNFNVGNLFNVVQSTGSATLNASAFSLAGLTSLTLGTTSLGGYNATITSFSSDPYFTANSDNVVPTQKAIKAYISSQIGGGGSNLNVNTLTAGVIYVSGNTITTTTGVYINVPSKMNFTGGIDGMPLAFNFLLR